VEYEPETEPSLSPSQTVRGLRTFMATGVMFSLWMRSSGIGTPVVIGYILWLGGDQTTDIPLLMSLSYFACLVQVLSVNYVSGIRNKKRFVIICGCFEIFFRFAIVAVPLFLGPGPGRMYAVYVIVALGLGFAYLISPILNDWLALTIPESVRARYTGQRTTWTTVSGIIAGYLFGKFLDLYEPSPDPDVQYLGFALLFLSGLVTGVAGYLLLLRAPVPPVPTEREGSVREAMADMLRDRPLFRLLFYSILQQFVIGLSMSFYMVYFIDQLRLPYATIAIYTNIALVATIGAYKGCSSLVDRFGSKPVMQLLVIPGALGQMLRIFASEDCTYLVPVSMSIYAMFHAGMLVCTSPWLYALLERKSGRPAYFAAWNTAASLSAGIGPLVGGVLARHLEDFHAEWFGFPIGNLQIVFLCTTVGLIALTPLQMCLEERRARTAGSLIASVSKGNPLTYLYNILSLAYLSRETSRVRATAGLVRSGSPLAGEDLIKALDDINPEVRRTAAAGLGDLKDEDAVAPLIEEMADTESDIRAEAAEALGKIGHPLGLDALIDAMNDQRPSVRISAIRGLGEVGGEGIRKLLYERLTEGEFDRSMFPTLVDVLSKLGETRIVAIGLDRLREFQSPVVRAQILNSVCRSLGAEETFYRLAVLDELKQATRIGMAFQKAQKDLGRLRDRLPWTTETAEAVARIREQFEQGRYQEVFAMMRQVAEQMMGRTGDEGQGTGDQGQGTRDEGRGTGDQGQGTRGEGPGTGDQGQETRDQAVVRARAAAGALVQFASTLSGRDVDLQEFAFASVCFCLCVTELSKAGPSLVAGQANSDGNESVP
jgi:MFS family permease